MGSSDCINGIVALIFTNLLLWKTYDSYCFLRVITQFMHTLFNSLSFTTVMLIAIDRYLHIKYLQRYPVIMTRKRARSLAVAACVYQALVAFCSSAPFLKHYTKLAKLVNILGATIAIIAVIILYYKIIKAVKSRVSSVHDSFMSSTVVRIKTLANVALSISICMTLLLTPYVISVLISDLRTRFSAENKKELAIFKWFTYIASLANGVCSCVIFTAHNKLVKSFLRMQYCVA